VQTRQLLEVLSQLIDASPYTRGGFGRTSSYRAPYADLIYAFYRQFSWGMRQIAAILKTTGRPWAWTSWYPVTVN
jgi:hypothetical protein